jgi:hypothetical protein
MKIEFVSAPFDPGMLNRLIDLSRIILKNNRNRTWWNRIALITDDIAIAMSALDDPLASVDVSAHRYLGYCWGNNGDHILWIRNRFTEIPRSDNPLDSQLTRYISDSAMRDMTFTLCHEVAHALAGTRHNATWRRAYALLLPFFVYEFCPRSPNMSVLTLGDVTLTAFHSSTVTTRFAPDFTLVDKAIDSCVYTYSGRGARAETLERFNDLQTDEKITYKVAARKSWDRWSHRVV